VRSVVDDAIADVRPQLEDREVHLSVLELPATVEADPTLLKQVFVNLLSNAIKYTRGRDEAEVEVGAFEENGETAFFVRDNGVGFDMRYADKLFQVFQRLHRAEEYEGAGVGLALVARIVRRHGGRIWAESEPDKGATFSFTLGGQAQW
jgi:two-component system, sensor histidine kinase and response regulator